MTVLKKEEIVLKKIFMYLAILNILDAVITFWGLQHSIIEESNLLLRFLYDSNPLYFLALKVSLSCGLLSFSIFNKLPARPFIRKLAYTATILYTLICFYHGVWITKVVSDLLVF